MLVPCSVGQIASFVFAGCTNSTARVYVGSNNNFPKKRHLPGEAGEKDNAKAILIAFVFAIWIGLRRARTFSAEIVRLFGAILFLTLVAAPADATSIGDFRNMSIRTGALLKPQFYDLLKKNNDANVAVKYFKQEVDFDGLTDISFQSRQTKKFYDLFFVPLSNSQKDEKTRNIVVSAKGPNGTQVFLGSISMGPDKKPQVKEEKRVENGKVEPGKGHLQKFFECAGAGCGSYAIVCVFGGPEWVPCFCTGCAGAAITCGFLDMFSR